ncbi:MAG TPA: Na+/H+ antiporter NhaA [Rhodospirillaceae bacterium]|nr:Na+/H+ antiporter NhaA [Alphaproteobacteria bacterium]OUT41363.1 MAG: Na+/H+ antiporter NhaA [Micavibrio sp. TMED2]HCI46434.1 Na+/H+ antiporter NhaA [Rhodospirillaceae bacterium]MAS47101.1 Na+/H+ antiporter NhaA [Alphaproteobacteria bacterium]MAX95196.1 Na+/H+ antiporter NhaA [Alphaproteobacteria bacterium]|tara:strand:+ start:31460 stop:32710 length:1251 start_codon:yes stop_codon:yes gene_type:complete
MRPAIVKKPLTFIQDFLRTEASGGIILMFVALIALIWSNSPAAHLYDEILHVHIAFSIGDWLEIDKSMVHWINDGLMAIFFLLVGLEIKREMLTGELSNIKTAALPAITALGGMAIPALIYVGINSGTPETLSGWAIPAATDIAFALGILALLGKRVPPSLKIFLLALAIIDDLGAVVIIALFYTAEVKMQAMAIAGGAMAALILLNIMGVRRLSWYFLFGLILWVAVLKSGIHATLAGVALALCIPLRGDEDAFTTAKYSSPLEHLEHSLHGFVAFIVLPIFALANAGVSLKGLSFSELFEPVPLGIMLGLLIGKQVGVFGFGFVAIKLKLCKLPEGAKWIQFYATSLLAGIGFTMSLFIGNLAFSDPVYATDVRLGVLAGSILSGILGYALLRFCTDKPEADNADEETASMAQG